MLKWHSTLLVIWAYPDFHGMKQIVVLLHVPPLDGMQDGKPFASVQ